MIQFGTTPHNPITARQRKKSSLSTFGPFGVVLAKRSLPSLRSLQRRTPERASNFTTSTSTRCRTLPLKLGFQLSVFSLCDSEPALIGLDQMPTFRAFRNKEKLGTVVGAVPQRLTVRLASDVVVIGQGVDRCCPGVCPDDRWAAAIRLTIIGSRRIVVARMPCRIRIGDVWLVVSLVI